MPVLALLLVLASAALPLPITAQSDAEAQSGRARVEEEGSAPCASDSDPQSDVGLSIRPNVRTEYHDPAKSTYVIDSSPAGFGVSGGLDLSLDGPELGVAATIFPDYRHLVPDPSVLNLTGVEIFFEEKRPFFERRADSFTFSLGAPFATRGRTFANDRAFHSRRVGADGRELRLGSPDTRNSPDEELEAATFMSASLADNWWVGLMDGLTHRRDEGQRHSGRTNYAVGRIGGQLTAATRLNGILTSAHNFSSSSGEGLLPSSAQSFGLSATHEFERLDVSGTVIGSRVHGDSETVVSLQQEAGHYFQRPDAPHLHVDSSASSMAGVLLDVRIESKGDGPWDLLGFVHAISPGFDVNDAGYLRDADWLLVGARFSYDFRPGSGPIERVRVGSDRVGVGWSFGGELRAAPLNGVARATFTNGWTASLAYTREFPVLSTDLLQGGPAVRLPPQDAVRMELGTDSDGAWHVSVAGTASRQEGSGGHSLGVSPSIRLASGSNLTVALHATPYRRFVNQWEFLTTVEADQGLEHIVGRFDLRAMSARVEVDYSPSPGLTLRMSSQPYLSGARMTDLTYVRDADSPRPEDRFGGSVDPSTLNVPTRVTATEMRTTAEIRWALTPRAALSLVWRHDGSAFDKTRDRGAWGRFGDLEDLGGTDEILLKARYEMTWGRSAGASNR